MILKACDCLIWKYFIQRMNNLVLIDLLMNHYWCILQLFYTAPQNYKGNVHTQYKENTGKHFRTDIVKLFSVL